MLLQQALDTTQPLRVEYPEVMRLVKQGAAMVDESVSDNSESSFDERDVRKLKPVVERPLLALTELAAHVRKQLQAEIIARIIDMRYTAGTKSASCSYLFDAAAMAHPNFVGLRWADRWGDAGHVAEVKGRIKAVITDLLVAIIKAGGGDGDGAAGGGAAGAAGRGQLTLLQAVRPKERSTSTHKSDR